MDKKTIKKIGILTIFFFYAAQLNIKAQMDCASTLKFRYTNPPFKFDEQSKSSVCYSGEKYEYTVSLLGNSEYRFSFFASSIFNNNIRFKIINISTGELLLDLPGEAAGNNTSAILQDYFDRKQNKFIHPYYDINPESDCNYKVIIEVGELKPTAGLNSSITIADPNQQKGCVTVFLQSKAAEQFGF